MRLWWRGISLSAAAAVLSGCGISTSAPPDETPEARSATTPTATTTPTAATTPAKLTATPAKPTATSTAKAPPETTPTPSTVPSPTRAPTPVARGMVFGGNGRQVALQDVSDQVVQSRRWQRISAMRDRVEEVAAQMQGVVPRQRAELTGTSADFGRFSYTYTPDGSVQPDAAWVDRYIRTEQVPILGTVTCHRLMLPQLRNALQQVVDSGLSSAIHPEEYGGCYVPRFIASDPANPLSLHTWGIAVDLNVPGNQRGVAGEIDRRVVGIFKSWGFSWGGDWGYTDPMHFELATLY